MIKPLSHQVFALCGHSGNLMGLVAPVEIGSACPRSEGSGYELQLNLKLARSKDLVMRPADLPDAKFGK